MNTFADRVISFNKQLEFNGKLPRGVRIMNPFRENDHALEISSAFYKKYYNDNRERKIILGINPGRFGAGITGIPFTDPKRAVEKCGLRYQGDPAHEPSSVFVYEVIEAYGGPEKFYGDIYINSICPLGFTARNEKGREVNYNYYDQPSLVKTVRHFIIDNIKKQIALGVETKVCYCFGTGKNESFLRKLNQEHCFFENIIALEHPRFIMQYKAKSKTQYIDKYLRAFEMEKGG
ncbi:MAG TPA: uracil-DNA glycosylase family protein [Bacteroidia bacterium]|jgi:hypothetical protein